MNAFERVSGSIYWINIFEPVGTGFGFYQPDLVVTSWWTVKRHFEEGMPITAIDNAGVAHAAVVLSSSPPEQYNYVILQISGPSSCGVLSVEPSTDLPLGTSLIVAGYPHRFGHVLAHQCFLAGRRSASTFYIDRPLDSGYFGAPVVAAETGLVVGFVDEKLDAKPGGVKVSRDSSTPERAAIGGERVVKLLPSPGRGPYQRQFAQVRSSQVLTAALLT